MDQVDDIEELEAMWRAMGERIKKLRARAEDAPKPVVVREPGPEVYAKIAALRRRRGQSYGT